MIHDRAYHRFKDKVKRDRRIDIIRRLWNWRSWEWIRHNSRRIGQLVKGKVHCSCPDCSPKTGRDGYKKSDFIRLTAADEEFMEEYETLYKQLTQGVKFSR